MISIKNAPEEGAFCCSVDPVDRARYLFPGNGDLRPQKDRKMGFCEFNQIRPICERTLSTYLTEFLDKILCVVSR